MSRHPRRACWPRLIPNVYRRIRALIAKAQASMGPFSRAVSENGSRVQRGGAMGSESWLIAQMALSRIEATRFPVTEALSGLDAVRREMMDGGLTVDDAVIDDAVLQVEAINAAQQSEINRLSGRLRSR